MTLADGILVLANVLYATSYVATHLEPRAPEGGGAARGHLPDRPAGRRRAPRRGQRLGEPLTAFTVAGGLLTVGGLALTVAGGAPAPAAVRET